MHLDICNLAVNGILKRPCLLNGNTLMKRPVASKWTNTCKTTTGLKETFQPRTRLRVSSPNNAQISMAKTLTTPLSKLSSSSLIPRRFYSPPSILDQTLPEDNSQTEDDVQEGPLNINVGNIAFDNDFGTVGNKHKLANGTDNLNPVKSQQKGVICRQLGAAEHMFHVSIQTGSEIVCLGTEIVSVYPICEHLAEQALVSLLKRHLMLRLNIIPDPLNEGRFVFQERKPFLYDFLCLNQLHWLDVLIKETRLHFDDNDLPLFRCRMLRPCKEEVKLGVAQKEMIQDQFKFRTQFLFIGHHSVFDGGYCIWVFQEFVNYLDDLITGTSKRMIKELPLLPPMETFLPKTSAKAAVIQKSVPALADKTTNISIEYGYHPQETAMLDAYADTYASEIRDKASSQPRNGVECFKMTPGETRRFQKMCKTNGSSSTGVMTAVSILSLLDLIFGSNQSIDQVKVPIEYLVDLRKFFEVPGSTDHYPGLSTGHVPLTIHIQRYVKSQRQSIFKELSLKLSNIIKDTNNYSNMISDIQNSVEHLKKYPKYKIPRGKSPGVLCISHMGNCSNVFNRDVSERVRLTDLNGFSSVLVDDMPLFVTNTVVINGSLQGNISYCETYTSKSTAIKYLDLIMSYLIPVSVL